MEPNMATGSEISRSPNLYHTLPNPSIDPHLTFLTLWTLDGVKSPIDSNLPIIPLIDIRSSLRSSTPNLIISYQLGHQP